MFRKSMSLFSYAKGETKGLEVEDSMKKMGGSIR